jgi:hypothetical protein
LWKGFDEVTAFRKVTKVYQPQDLKERTTLYQGWRNAVHQLIK